MEEIEETEDGFGKTVAKSTVMAAATTFGMGVGLIAAGWAVGNIRTNIKRIKINFETKTEEEEV